jgi:hypothetical protein
VSDPAVQKTPKQKKPIQILRERQGGMPKELLERNKRQATARRQLRTALKDGPKIVPELAKATGLATQETFWLLMGMKKYGELAEGAERDGYYEYMLIPDPNQE